MTELRVVEAKTLFLFFVELAAQMTSAEVLFAKSVSEEDMTGDARLQECLKIIRRMADVQLKEQCLRSEWNSLPPLDDKDGVSVERDIILDAVRDEAFWDDIQRVAEAELAAEGDLAELEDESDSRERFLKMFRCFDKDGSGSIESAELHALLLYLGITTTEEELRQVFTAVDKDKSGGISEKEFLDYLMKCGHLDEPSVLEEDE